MLTIESGGRLAQLGERRVRNAEVAGSIPVPSTIHLMFTVYILQSQTTGRFYVGHTKNLEERIHRHNSGQTKLGRNRGPWKLVHSTAYLTRSEAMRRERQIKSWKSHRYLQKLIQESGGMLPEGSAEE